MRKRMSVLVGGLVSLLLILTGAPVSAQGTPLPDGAGLISTIDANTPFQFFTLSMEAGDLVSLRVTSLDPGAMLPTVSISSPAGQQLAFSSGDPTSPAPGSARINLRSEQTGTYNVQVGSSNSGTGQFVIQTDILQAAEVVPLTTPTVLQFNPQQTVIAVNITQTPDSVQDFTVVGGETRLYVAMHGGDGTLLSVDSVQGTLTITIPAGSMTYTAIITNMDASSVTAEVSAVPSTGSTTSNEGEAPAPPPTSGDACTITTGSGGTNLRTGPGTNYDIIATLPADTSYTATGQNSSWYTIDYLGETGWLAGSVTTLSGPCDSLPFVEAPSTSGGSDSPPPPASTEEATGSEATATQSSSQPTATVPSSQPTEAPGQPTQPPSQPTQVPPTQVPPTQVPPTEPAAQVAPPDSALFVEVSIKNGQATVSDAVSYPGGDTQDEIFWDVVDFDSITTAGDLEVIITCTGTGTQNVTFFSSGSNYSCGDVIERFVTNVSDSGLIRVTATSGTDTYVQYTLLLRGTPAN